MREKRLEEGRERERFVRGEESDGSTHVNRVALVGAKAKGHTKVTAAMRGPE